MANILPDYKKNSIVNLMSAILHGYNAPSKYAPLDKNLISQIKSAKNVVLLIIDGVGVDSMGKLLKKSFYRTNFKQELTSVFPSTTTSAVTTFATGTAPQEHGLLAWYLNLKELGSIVSILPFVTRQGQPIEITKKQLKVPRGIFEKISSSNDKLETYTVVPKKIMGGKYNAFFSGKSQSHGFKTIGGLCNKLTKIIKSNKKRKYIYAYWPEFDSISHDLGKTSKKARTHLQEIDEKLTLLVKKLKNTNTLLLVTADHGQIVTSKKKTIVLNKHPLLKECLSAPVSGEPRAAFCYVYQHKIQQFEKYVKHQLGRYCTLHKSQDIIADGLFGLGKPHPRLLDRAGDYILLLKDNYVFLDYIAGEEEKNMQGHHGGLSKEEMLVPLVVKKC